jgi:hypothetical protein
MAHATFVSYEIKSAKSRSRYARISAQALDTPPPPFICEGRLGGGGGGVDANIEKCNFFLHREKLISSGKVFPVKICECNLSLTATGAEIIAHQ